MNDTWPPPSVATSNDTLPPLNVVTRNDTSPSLNCAAPNVNRPRLTVALSNITWQPTNYVVVNVPEVTTLGSTCDHKTMVAAASNPAIVKVAAQKMVS